MNNNIKELFAVILKVPVDSIHDETRPATLEKWDSLQHLILVSSLEEEFDIDIDPEEVVEMYTDFKTFCQIILRKLDS